MRRSNLLLLSALLLVACSTPATPPGPEVYPAPLDAPTSYPAPLQQPAYTPPAAYPGPQADQSVGICQPTPPDSLGPFYTPGAPVRSSVGQGYILSGVVRSLDGCAAAPGAQLELWLVGPDGQYADAYRATLFADGQGRYNFESHIPPPYENRPPHIHLKVTAPGFQELITQHYPQDGAAEGVMDLVLTR